VAQLGLTSLALPVLRVRRQLADDDLLLVTLAALFEQLAGATLLQRVFVCVEAEEQARLVAHLDGDVLHELRAIGELRAATERLDTAESAAAALLEDSLREPFVDALRRQRKAYLDATRRRLDLLTLQPSQVGMGAFQMELSYCYAEFDKLEATLQPPLFRQVGE
jgi:hypothetical protein